MGKIIAIGIGPGSADDMTARAQAAIENADTVVGYTTYIKLIMPLLANTDKKIIGTGMMREIDRCRAAIAAAKTETVAVVSSGDAGIYGMAGLIAELIGNMPADERPRFEVIPGVSAVNAAAAILGAPLMHDFAVISLSDLLTPWEKIANRIEMAAAADFVIALYNPKSKRRPDNIFSAQEILLKHKKNQTPVGIVTNAFRENERKVLSTLDKFTEEDISMFSTVVIGNSATVIENGLMITPRGYENKADFATTSTGGTQ